MRFLLTASTATLVAGLLGCGFAAAQGASGWVDPPAKSGVQDGTKVATGKAGPSAGTAAAATTPTARSGEAERMVETPPRVGQSRRSAQTSPRRARAAEIRRERRNRVRDGETRMAVSPTRPDPAGEGGQDARFAEWAPVAQHLAEAYLDTVSASNAEMVAAAPGFYAERVRFYGRSVTLSALIADKRRFARRWPERRYEPQDMRTACNAATATCVVRTTVVFSAGNPARGVRSRGVSELALTISFAGGRPVIVGETGQVVRRGDPSLGALTRAGRDA